jgi:undecaprenyl-diphosphatase
MGSHNADARMGWYVILGSIPIVVLGVAFKDVIETAFRNLYLTAFVLAFFGLVLGWADRVGAKRREIRDLRPRDAAILGFAQAMALIPGVSRSGGTISAGLFLGLTREAAARFSFLLAIPAVLGSGFFELFTEWGELTAPDGPGLVPTLIASATAFVVGYAVIVWFLKLLKTGSFIPFVIYRICFAGLIVVLLGSGVLSAT